MSLWGNNDNKGSGGTVTLNYATGIVTGTGTTFGNVGAAKTGDVIRFGFRGSGGTYFGDAVIVGIASTTQLTIGSTAGLSGAAIAATSFYISELPKYTVLDYRYSNKLDRAQTLNNFGVTGTASTNSGIGTNIVRLNTVGVDVLAGDTLLNNGVDVLISSVSSTQVTLASTIGAGIATGATLTFKRYTGGYDKQVYGISTSTSSVAVGYSGFTHQGWVGILTYRDTHGNLRVKSEVLVAGSGISTGVDSILYPTPR